MKDIFSIRDLTSSESDAVFELEDGSRVFVQLKATQSRRDVEKTFAKWRTQLPLVSRPEVNARLIVASLKAEVAAQVAQFAMLAVQDKRATERLISAMFTHNLVSSAAAEQARRNAEARQELIDEFGLFDSEQLADSVGSKAKNRSATASRWLAERRVFAVEHLGQRYFPAFQFGTDGRPRPIIQRVLEAFELFGLDSWEIALWFTTASGWLGDARPVDLLTAKPDDVVRSAQLTFGEWAA